MTGSLPTGLPNSVIVIHFHPSDCHQHKDCNHFPLTVNAFVPNQSADDHLSDPRASLYHVGSPSVWLALISFQLSSTSQPSVIAFSVDSPQPTSTADRLPQHSNLDRRLLVERVSDLKILDQYLAYPSTAHHRCKYPVSNRIPCQPHVRQR